MRGFVSMVALGTVVAGGAAGAASPFDGTYRGTSISSGGNYGCAPQREISVRVADGKFNYAGGGEGNRITIEVAADGRFSGQSGQRYLSGKIQGSSMTGTSSASQCNYQWALSKQ